MYTVFLDCGTGEGSGCEKRQVGVWLSDSICLNSVSQNKVYLGNCTENTSWFSVQYARSYANYNPK